VGLVGIGVGFEVGTIGFAALREGLGGSDCRSCFPTCFEAGFGDLTSGF
jgi:hypothetical protein